MLKTFLATKNFLPALPSTLLPRDRLLQDMNRLLDPQCRLALVCAPAGYGKSTLASEWGSRQTGARIAWLSLDEGDNDPVAFVTGLAGALGSALPGIQTHLAALLDSPQELPLQVVTTLLVNELTRIEQPLVLALDDYHRIHTEDIHRCVAHLLDHLPEHVHLLIATRSDPPLPIHRYRARGQVVEIRAAELRFNPREVAPLIQRLAGITLSSGESALLDERIEGWAAGLQMAALALRGKHDPGSLLASLSGSQRYVLDYLAEEVFRAQTLEVRRFLLGTSLLERFNSTLCAEVLQDTRAIVTLAALERDNLFIIPLDDAARDAGFHWYRYHHLFADLLKMRAAQDPDLHPAELHRRAAAWFERNGWTTDAVHHTILAGDHRHAAELVEQHTLALFSQGELNRLLGWINMLPVEVASQRPRLKLYQAWATAFAGRIAETEQLIEQAEQLATKAGGEVTEAALMADAACIRGVTAAMTGRFDQALALETLPGDLLEGLSPFTRCGVDWALGFAYRGRGDLARAGQAFEHMLITARGHHLLWTLITASVDYGAILRLGGNLRQAEAVYREALATATQAGAASSGYLGRLESFLANILYEQNRLEEAGNVVQASIAHNRFWQNANHIVHAYLAAARIEQAKGNRAAAAEALRQADDAAQAETLVTTLRAGLEAVQVRIWLDAGDMARALRWARDRKAHLSGGTIYDEAQAQILVGIARVLHAAGERGEAWAILSALAEQLQQRSLVNPLIEVLTLKAQCAPAQGEALAVLEQALRLGLPEGYARTFLDEGPRVLGLLQACRASGSLNGELRIYLDDLLRQAGVPAEPQVSGVPTPLGLTGRELEILAAMSRGLNNQQIGAALFISAGTVKAHSASIYRKLNVANRTEAIARAKDSRLI